MLMRNVYVLSNSTHLRQIKNISISEAGQLTILDAIHPALKPDFILMPGLLDAHVHGFGGADFSEAGGDPAVLHSITQSLGAAGVSYAMATLMSLPLPLLENCLHVIDRYVQSQIISPQKGHTKIVGIHLEGPFIAKDCKGSHDESALLSEINLPLFKKIIAHAPHVTQWKITLAPDLSGAKQFINDVKMLEQEGISVKVSLGHTNPEKKTITDAISAGAIGFTHLGNACMETCCRLAQELTKQDAQSNLVQWVLENKEQCPSGVELIVDGVHLSQSFVRLIREAIGNKIMLVSDALGPSGLSDGLYSFGAQYIRKCDQYFYLAKSNGDYILKENNKILAGSGASLPFCLAQFSDWIKDWDENYLSTIYSSVVTNPRISSLSQEAIAALPDDDNWVIVDKNGRVSVGCISGKLILCADKK
jgi:N-acetylglucosamine-6-phosphate deacetylase